MYSGLPAYSPGFNPNDMMRSKVKALLCATEARTQHDLIQAIGYALHCVAAQDALHCLPIVATVLFKMP